VDVWVRLPLFPPRRCWELVIPPRSKRDSSQGLAGSNPAVSAQGSAAIGDAAELEPQWLKRVCPFDSDRFRSWRDGNMVTQPRWKRGGSETGLWIRLPLSPLMPRWTNRKSRRAFTPEFIAGSSPARGAKLPWCSGSIAVSQTVGPGSEPGGSALAGQPALGSEKTSRFGHPRHGACRDPPDHGM
jgi:hypothetical protein